MLQTCTILRRAADKDYLHDVIKGPNNVDLHFLYKTIQRLLPIGNFATQNRKAYGNL